MYGIFTPDGVRIGTVAKFVGNVPKERWVAWSMTDPGGSGHRFPTQREAIAWLKQVVEDDKKPGS